MEEGGRGREDRDKRDRDREDKPSKENLAMYIERICHFYIF